jgi:peptidoglycan/LPS O-acetylase OafA/YrhL
MIQRQQTLWLILSFIALLLSFVFPFATGTVLEGNLAAIQLLKAGSEFLLLILVGIGIALAAVTIFLYKNRRQQIMLAVAGAIVTAGAIVLFFVEFKKMSSATLALSSILPLIGFLGFIMAGRNIRKDEKLIKSLNKLR